MTLKKTLLITLCLIGLVPVGILAGSSLVEVRNAIEHDAFNHLEATKNLKKDVMERYLDQIRHQIASLATSEVTRRAVGDFSSAFKSYARDTASKRSTTTQVVGQYYQQEFLPVYQDLTGGATLNTQSLLTPVDDNGLALQSAYIANNLGTGMNQKCNTRVQRGGG